MDNVLSLLLSTADDNQSAIPAFNVHNLEFIEGVVRSGVALRGACMLEVGPKTLKFVDLRVWFDLAHAVMGQYGVRLPLHLDHSVDPNLCLEAIRLGFDSVMFDGSGLPFADNVRTTQEIVRAAHAHHVLVEGEIGPITHDPKQRVSVASIREFAERTQVDLLASGFGTEHGNSTDRLDIDRIGALAQFGVPLVLHGSSGVPPAWLAQSVSAGIRKVNVGTALNHAFMQTFLGCAVRDDPRELLEAARQHITEECVKFGKILRQEGEAS